MLSEIMADGIYPLLAHPCRYQYMEEKDMIKLVEACFRKPADHENPQTMNTSAMLQVIKNEYPTLKIDQGARIQLGLAMKELNFERREHSHVAYYKVIPLHAA